MTTTTHSNTTMIINESPQLPNQRQRVRRHRRSATLSPCTSAIRNDAGMLSMRLIEITCRRALARVPHGRHAHDDDEQRRGAAAEFVNVRQADDELCADTAGQVAQTPATGRPADAAQSCNVPVAQSAAVVAAAPSATASHPADIRIKASGVHVQSGRAPHDHINRFVHVQRQCGQCEAACQCATVGDSVVITFSA